MECLDRRRSDRGLPGLPGGRFVGIATSRAFTDRGLAPRTSYAYTVAAFDDAGNVSGRSAPLDVRTGRPAPRFVQQANATPQSPHASVSATYARGQRAGDANIVAIGWNDTAARVTSVTDDAGNAYRRAVGTFRGTA